MTLSLFDFRFMAQAGLGEAVRAMGHDVAVATIWIVISVLGLSFGIFGTISGCLGGRRTNEALWLGATSLLLGTAQMVASIWLHFFYLSMILTSILAMLSGIFALLAWYRASRLTSK